VTEKHDSEKIIFTALLVSGGALFLPLYEVRPNRVAEGFSAGILSLPEPSWLILPLVPLLLFAALLLSPQGRLRSAILASSTAAGTAALLLFLALVSRYYALNGPATVRTGPAIGMVFLLFALLIPLIGLGFSRSRLFVSTAVIGVLIIFFLTANGFDTLGIVREALNRRDRLLAEIINHLRLSLSSVAIASVIGIPAAFLAAKRKKTRSVIFGIINIFQTIPSIALFGLLIAPIAALGRAFPLLREMGIRGIGDAPAIIALATYSLFPIIRNTFSGIEGLSRPVLDAAEAMGMNERQLRRIIILPNTMPFIVHGIRLAVIQSIGNATLAKLIGAGGLGVFIFEGLGQSSIDMVLLGIIFLAALTIAADGGLQFAGWFLTPKALRGRFGEES
jgi:osmoprotectant transport system permease protein